MLTDKEIEVLMLRKANLTQTTVAKKLGISQAAVSNFEKNARRKIDDAGKVLKLAENLNLRAVKSEKTAH